MLILFYVVFLYHFLSLLRFLDFCYTVKIWLLLIFIFTFMLMLQIFSERERGSQFFWNGLSFTFGIRATHLFLVCNNNIILHQQKA